MAHNRNPDTSEHFHKHLAKQHQREEYNWFFFLCYVFEFGEMVSFSEHLISVPKPVTDLDRSPSHKQESAGLHSHLLVKSKQVIVGKNIWTHILKHV